jgi:hypothetical protein
VQGVCCDACGAAPIVGVRYSKRNADWDLCSVDFGRLPVGEQALYDALPVACDRELVTAQVAAALALSGIAAAAGGDENERASLRALLGTAGAMKAAYAAHEQALATIAARLQALDTGTGDDAVAAADGGASGSRGEKRKVDDG